MGDEDEFLLSMPDKYRLPIIMHYYEGNTYEEISKIVDVPLGTVKSRINRARLQLQDQLKEYK